MPVSKTKEYRKSNCKKGTIRRAGYIRNSYRRTDGTIVARATVAPACVRDMGRPGKTKDVDKILPQPDQDIHLSKYGYFLDRPKPTRQESLRRASSAYGNLRVLRRLNLIRNLTAYEKNYKKLTDDVDYLSSRYSKIMGRTKSKSKKSHTPE